jgi:hypothetical protein
MGGVMWTVRELNRVCDHFLKCNGFTHKIQNKSIADQIVITEWKPTQLIQCKIQVGGECLQHESQYGYVTIFNDA